MGIRQGNSRKVAGKVLDRFLAGLMPRLLANRKPVVVLSQLGLVAVAYFSALFMALGVAQPYPWRKALISFVVVLAVRLAAMAYFRLFHGLWRYVTPYDLLQVLKATTVGSLLFVPVGLFVFGRSEFPARVALLDWLLVNVSLGGIRVLVRLTLERMDQTNSKQPQRKPMLIVGAGDAGAVLCKQAITSHDFTHTPVAFVDDSPGMLKTEISGVRVQGTIQDIPALVRRYAIDTIVIAIPSAPPDEVRRIVTYCQQSGAQYRILPGTQDVLEGKVSIRSLREIHPADLLGRPQARMDMGLITKAIKGESILITGAAGSVGSELARQIASLEPGSLALIDRAENGLLSTEAELNDRFRLGDRLVSRVVDVTDETHMMRVMSEFKPRIVLHAAAYKHVRFMEQSPAQAIVNNVWGARIAALAAERAGVEEFVLVSTDKAVNPTSVMGASKRAAELLVKDLSRSSRMAFITVRFGNVIGSEGSVVPIFTRQIANGGPVTVTHQDVKRFFMSIPEAAGLILQAAAAGGNGDCFVLDMGEQIRIATLAETMISLAGYVPLRDIKIVYTGLLPGEKMEEELVGPGESLVPTRFPKLLLVRGAPPREDVTKQLTDLCIAAPQLTQEQIKSRLHDIIPEYTAANSSGPHASPPGLGGR